MKTLPDTTKTELVENLIANGEAITGVRVEGRAGAKWVVFAEFAYPEDWSEPIAVCSHPLYASAVAHAVAGSVDCDLDVSALEDK